MVQVRLERQRVVSRRGGFFANAQPPHILKRLYRMKKQALSTSQVTEGQEPTQQPVLLAASQPANEEGELAKETPQRALSRELSTEAAGDRKVQQPGSDREGGGPRLLLAQPRGSEPKPARATARESMDRYGEHFVTVDVPRH